MTENEQLSAVRTVPTNDEDGLTRAARRRRYVAAGGAAAMIVAGGGAIAWASTASASGAATGANAAAHHAPQNKPATRGPSVDGTVTAVDGTQITVTDPQGFTRTIVTSDDTTYKNDLTATPDVGTKIHAEGTVDSDGTSLDATVISKAQRHPGGGHGGPGGPGRGGPGHGAHAGPRPTGSAPTDVPSSDTPSSDTTS